MGGEVEGERRGVSRPIVGIGEVGNPRPEIHGEVSGEEKRDGGGEFKRRMGDEGRGRVEDIEAMEMKGRIGWLIL